MFANAQLARMAAEKELEEAQGRTTAQHALANARAQAAQRALVVAKEKASNEAKSEFMSLMCHEVRGGRRMMLKCVLPSVVLPLRTTRLGIPIQWRVALSMLRLIRGSVQPYGFPLSL